MIGKAPLLPIWANGFHSRAPTYVTDDIVNAAIKGYLDNKYPLEGLGIPLQAVNNMYNLDYKISFNTLHTKYPQLKWMIPFGALVNEKPENEEMIKSMRAQNLLVTVNGDPVLSYDRDDMGSYAVDYFNPNITAFMKTFFAKIHT